MSADNSSMEGSSSSGPGLRIMEKMGYMSGTGLGKNNQGITRAIETLQHLGKRGLGHKTVNLEPSEEEWDFSKDDVEVHQKVMWLENEPDNSQNVTQTTLNSWMKEGKPILDIESTFCDPQILHDVFEAKTIFNESNLTEMLKARTRANPFETIKSVFFMNRAALKMANIDAATDFMFTNLEDSSDFKDEKGPIYFADVCAGPGGFTEYILWRKKWLYKGFGLTLKDDNDFVLWVSMCSSPVTFQALYGKNEDGDIRRPENITDFVERVRHETNGGVHFMMSDGGFSVDGVEELQEIMSKNIYICQCLLALKILRPNGHFVTKLFDIFTPFSVGLLYLMHLCFDKVGIIKPKSSRPANSERYFVCKRFRDDSRSNLIQQYLWKAVCILWETLNKDNLDILELVPLKVLKKDTKFFDYIVASNNNIGENQIRALKKLASFCRNPKQIDVRQAELRRQCLEYWNIPDEPRKAPTSIRIEEFLKQIGIPPYKFRNPSTLIIETCLQSLVENLEDWCYYFTETQARFFVGHKRSRAYQWGPYGWVHVDNLSLAPGTLLCGDLVMEQLHTSDEAEVKTRPSLLVFDAIRLGSLNMKEMNFRQRQEKIKVYCMSINKESQKEESIRVRHADWRELTQFPSDDRISEGNVKLPVLGFRTLSEDFNSNFILLVNATKCKFNTWVPYFYTLGKSKTRHLIDYVRELLPR